MSSAGLEIERIRAEEIEILPRCFGNGFELNFDESIMIFLNVSGNMISSLRVFQSDSIESMKMRIRDCKGLVVNSQNMKLVCSGRELARSDSRLRDYGVGDGDVIHLVTKLANLQAITVRTVNGKELKFNVGRFRDVAFVKKEIAKTGKGHGLEVDEENQELVYEGERLEDQRLIDEFCKKNEDAVIHLLIKKSAKVRQGPVGKNWEIDVDASESIGGRKYDIEYDGTVEVPRENFENGFYLEPVVVNPKSEVPSAILDVIDMTYDGLANGHSPIMAGEGSGGVYIMQDSTGSEYVSVFKPRDEEPNAMNNPHGLPFSPDGEGLKRGTKVGQGALKEVAAYLLDHPMSGRRGISGEGVGFAGVPPTGFVRCLHEGFNHPSGITTKIGSLQKYMKNNGSCEDMGPGAFPVEEVHKISVLDMRLANADRHAGNILRSKDSETGRLTLIPIDHGYCLPESFEDCTFEWLYWPQAKQPYSPETIDYIRSLDAEEDIALLKFYGWDMEVATARTLRISTMLLKKGVERGLTPYAIGSIMCRVTLTKESLIEEIVREAEDSVLPETSEATFIEAVSEIMDRRLDEIS